MEQSLLSVDKSRAVVVTCFVFLLATGTCTATRLGQRVLSPGLWGADVFELQMRLKDMGYDVIADGRFGPSTKNAVIAFQRSKKIPADGVVGLQTTTHIIARWGLLKHRVVKGDTVSGLARQLGVSPGEIRVLNGLSDDTIRVGQVLNIPAPPEYTVREGDTLERIAALSNSSPEELVALNRLTGSAKLRPGMLLRLPKPTY